VDRNAHGGTPLLAWYLQQFKQYEQAHGKRLLDYVDMHAYLAPAAIGGTTGTESAAVQALRLDSTRVYWDPTYIVTGDYWIKDVENNGAPVAPLTSPGCAPSSIRTTRARSSPSPNTTGPGRTR
jgi:hypothetical protein